ncbi:MAG: hypothetical protein AAF446_03600 [Pseudomonadota bacterium]
MKPFIPTDLRALHIRGPDAVAYIQSQVTLDLTAMSPQRFYPAAWCDPKGRAITVILIACRQDHVMAVIPKSQLDTTASRLKMYSIGRKVQFSAAEPFSARILDDERSPESLDEDWHRLSFDLGRAICVDPVSHRNIEFNPLYDQLWQEADLASRLPWLSPDTTGLFIPQMLGLETLEGLSYHKGCYPGQEVIARVHYRGKVTRKTVAFEIDTTESAPAVKQLDLGNQQGIVLYALKKSRNIVQGLAVVPVAVEHDRRFNWNNAEGRLIALHSGTEAPR